jgi:hypothetical protein
MLTLRPTRLSRDPNANDWSIHEDGVEIGRLYEDWTATRPTWFWSIIVMGRRGIRSGPTDGRRRWSRRRPISRRTGSVPAGPAGLGIRERLT